MAKKNFQRFDHRDSAPKLSLESTELSKHAKTRALDMGLEGSEIRKCIEHPTHAYFQSSTRQWIYSRGKVSLPIAFTERGVAVVKTILWAETKDWMQDAARAPLPDGRRAVRKKAA